MKKRPVINLTTKEWFSSVSEAAASIGVSPGMLVKHIRNNDSWNAHAEGAGDHKIKDYQFQYVTWSNSSGV